MIVETKATPKQKNLEQLFHESCTVEVHRALMHQAFQVPHAGTESTLSVDRVKGLQMRFHPGYGLIGFMKDKYFLSPATNVIVAHEK